LVILSHGHVSGQENLHFATDSFCLQSIKRTQIVAAGLLAGSIILHTGKLENRIQNFFPRTETRADNWLRLMPSAQIYLFDALGIRHKSSVFNQTKYLAASLATSAVVVEVLKNMTFVKRPGGGRNSYPSSHTCIAFAGATVLYHEFRDENPLLAYSGFVTAGATGFLRITNGAHWLPDVLGGAGLGMLITNLIYDVEPFGEKAGKSRKSKIMINSGISGARLCLTITF